MLKAKVTKKEYTFARRGVEVVTVGKGEILLGEDAEIAINSGVAEEVKEADSSKEPEKTTKYGAENESGDSNGDNSSSDNSEGSEEDDDPELSEGNGKKPEKNKPAKSPSKKK